jgi:hypothetical protein
LSLSLLLRIGGASLVLLALVHIVLWRSLHWDRECERLSPLNARVFAVHAFFVALVLLGLGLLSLLRPDLLLTPGELQRFLLVAIVVFWFLRLSLQPLVFDRVMTLGWTRTWPIRVGAHLLWAAYLVLYGAALLKQWPP